MSVTIKENRKNRCHGHTRDEKLDLLHFWRASKGKSSMVSALPSPLTSVKDVAKYNNLFAYSFDLGKGEFKWYG